MQRREPPPMTERQLKALERARLRAEREIARYNAEELRFRLKEAGEDEDDYRRWLRAAGRGQR